MVVIIDVEIIGITTLRGHSDGTNLALVWTERSGVA